MTEKQLKEGGDILRDIGWTNDNIRVLEEMIKKGSLTLEVRSCGGIGHSLHVDTRLTEALIRLNIDEERQRLKELQQAFDNL